MTRTAVGGIALFMLGFAALCAVGAVAAYAATTSYTVVSSSGLNERAAPSTASAKVGSLADGATVDIACQAAGISYTTGGSPSSDDIWDQLTNGAFVADFWVNTPGRGAFSSGIARCGIAQVAVENFGPSVDLQVCGTNQDNASDCTPFYADPKNSDVYYFDYWFKGTVSVWVGNPTLSVGGAECTVPTGYSSSVYSCDPS